MRFRMITRFCKDMCSWVDKVSPEFSEDMHSLTDPVSPEFCDDVTYMIYETMIESFLSFKDFIQFTTTFLRDEFVLAN
ncbi:hypothetical protein L3X38_015355 [Prunus dulcis]|uniref:Uncharacterized protein n=1 Tax=Prunus dulcis TaxID=3755 RepID=A0AAD4WSC9_PRUDU|nr:hypothetical protein L3X38_015355 [Prunus dulcis]